MSDAFYAVRCVHVEPAMHGVTAFGAELQRALEVTRACRVTGLWIKPGTAVGETDLKTITHVQFSDNLWGSDAAAARRSVSTTLHSVNGPLVVTLHDVPDPHDDPRRWQRRAQAYEQVARRADRVVVCSRHERRRLHHIHPELAVDVVPNPLPHLPPVADSPRMGQGAVGVLGWVFPGKGHADVIRAVAGLPAPRQVVMLGAVVDGHAGYAAQLQELASCLGVPLTLTGWLGPVRQRQLMTMVDVAVAPHHDPSASGSMLAWIAAGRRPLVRRSSYAEELAGRAPEAVNLFDPSQLATAIHREIINPPPPAVTPAELAARTAATRYLRVYAQVATAAGLAAPARPALASPAPARPALASPALASPALARPALGRAAPPARAGL